MESEIAPGRMVGERVLAAFSASEWEWLSQRVDYLCAIQSVRTGQDLEGIIAVGKVLLLNRHTAKA